MALWSEIEAEILREILEAEFESAGTDHAYLLKWGNRLQQDIARRISIPGHLTEGTVAFTTVYSNTLPSTFLKISPRRTTAWVGSQKIPIIAKHELEYYDPTHAVTSTGTYPSYCAIREPNIYIYPIVACSLVIQNFYRKPVDMTGDSSSPDLPDADIMTDLIVKGVIAKADIWENEPEMQTEASTAFESYLEQYRQHISVHQFNRVAVPG